MKISIIMPSLNVVKYIRSCMQSVIDQTLQDIEIICVDAGSTDGTFEIIKEFAKKDNRITVITSPIKSYGYQMNLGIKAAKGEFIGIVETDDIIDYDMFECLYSYVKTNKVDFVKSSFFEYTNKYNKEYSVPHSNIKTKKISGKIINLNINSEYRLADIVHIWSAIYKRSFILENKLFFNETPGASFQDVSFSILVGLTAQYCIYLDKCYYHYRIDNPNSSVKSDSKITCLCDEYRYIFNYLQTREMLTDDIKKEIDLIRLETYNGDCKRLSYASRLKLLDSIANEMSSYNYDSLDEKHKEYYLNLTDKDKLKYIDEKSIYQKAWNEKLIEQLCSGERFNIVGTGNVFSILLALQDFLETRFIDQVSDNSTQKQGTVISGYTINSVEEIVKKNNNTWLIASYKYVDEIKQQLLKLGIPENKIIPLDKIYKFSEFVNYDLI